jgi:hypothetical protein
MFPGVLRHHAATLAVIAGAGCFAAAVGGLSTIDDDLRAAAAAAPVPPQQQAQPQTVVDRHDDCPWKRRAA